MKTAEVQAKEIAIKIIVDVLQEHILDDSIDIEITKHTDDDDRRQAELVLKAMRQFLADFGFKWGKLRQVFMKMRADQFPDF